MQLMCQGLEPRCVLYSLAMCLDVSIEYLEGLVGSTGLEPFYQDGSPRGHCLQECVDAALTCNHAIVEIQTNPYAINERGEIGGPIWSHTTCEFRLLQYLGSYRGLLHFEQPNGKLHMCAWDNASRMVFDPQGMTYDLMQSGKKLKAFYALVPVNMM